MKPTRLLILLTLVIGANLLASCSRHPDGMGTPSPRPATGPAAEALLKPVEGTLSGPYTHQNLSLFLVHGKDRVEGHEYLTLQEAMEQKKVRVYETGSVGELSIENVSDQEIYVQSGDIVKGGRQDRTLVNDYLVPPRSGRLPVASFCVESGRWQQRGSEQSTGFSGSNYGLASKDSKIAAKVYGDQGSVWRSVSQSQAKLSDNVSADVRSTTSPSSLQLTLENSKVIEATDQYIKALAKCVEGQDDAIGLAYAINGQFVSADLYGSHALFVKLWPKNLRSCAIEAVAELKKDQAFSPMTSQQMAQCLTVGTDVKITAQTIGKVELTTVESADRYLFETRPQATPAAWIHRNYIQRDRDAERQMRLQHDVTRQERYFTNRNTNNGNGNLSSTRPTTVPMTRPESTTRP